MARGYSVTLRPRSDKAIYKLRSAPGSFNSGTDGGRRITPPVECKCCDAAIFGCAAIKSNALRNSDSDPGNGPEPRWLILQFPG